MHFAYTTIYCFWPIETMNDIICSQIIFCDVLVRIQCNFYLQYILDILVILKRPEIIMRKPYYWHLHIFRHCFAIKESMNKFFETITITIFVGVFLYPFPRFQPTHLLLDKPIWLKLYSETLIGNTDCKNNV